MKASFIITTKNEEKYIKDTCKAILNQKGNFEKEIILVDSESEDNTVNIAKKYVNKLVVKKSLISQGKNIGAKISTGDILIFINADTILEKNWLINIIKYLNEKEIIAVYGLLKPRENNLKARIFVLIWNLVIYFTYLLGFPHISGECTLAIKRNYFFKVKGFNENFVCSEDIDLGLRLKKIGKVKLVKNCFGIVSLRRFEKEGYLKWALIWLIADLYFLLKKKSLLKIYPLVR